MYLIYISGCENGVIIMGHILGEGLITTTEQVRSSNVFFIIHRIIIYVKSSNKKRITQNTEFHG